MSRKFIEKPLSLMSEGKHIAATAHLPSDEKAASPIVVFCHGFTGNRIEQRYIFVRAARRLAMSDIASLRFDYRGCGESEGLFKEHTLLDYIKDTLNVIDYLPNLGGTDAGCAGILGYSIGGCVAAEVLGRRRELKTAVLWSPVAFPQQLFFERRQDLPAPEALPTEQDFIEYDGWAIGKGFIHSLSEVNPVERLAGYAGPVLLCQGSQDTVVPPYHSEAYLTARRQAERITEISHFPESNHGYKPLKEDERLLDETASWFYKYL
jgi:hypothetical protein